jgi:phosphoribosylglycinamide formyltransferase-1
MPAQPRGFSQTQERIATAILASGNGSNLEAVVAATRRGSLPLDIRLVVSNNPGAPALSRAARAGIPVAELEFDKRNESRAAYALRLAARIRASGARLVLLLGWMHVLAPEFLDAGFDGVLNLHPAYLPEDPAADSVRFPDGTHTPVFRGAHALRDALAAKVSLTGASLIQITPQVDRGPLLARKHMPLYPGENEATALERLHQVEREVVTEGVLRWIRDRRHA